MHYGESEAFDANCQSCVAIHEARLRGLNITAKGYSGNKDSASYLLGEHFELIWRNPKTGKSPQPTILRGENLLDKLDRQTRAVGRYHVGINSVNGTGHVVTAKRMKDGKFIVYDPQKNCFYNLKDFRDIEYFEVVKVDKMLIDGKLLKSISEII